MSGYEFHYWDDPENGEAEGGFQFVAVEPHWQGGPEWSCEQPA